MKNYKYPFYIALAVILSLSWHSFWRSKKYKAERDIYKNLAEYQSASSVYGIWQDLTKAYIIENTPSGPKLTIFPRNPSTNYTVEVNSRGEEQYVWYTEDGVGANRYSGEVTIGGKSVIIQYRHNWQFDDLSAYEGPGVGMGMDSYRIEATITENNTLEGTIVKITDKTNLHGKYSVVTNRFLAGRRIQ